MMSPCFLSKNTAVVYQTEIFGRFLEHFIPIQAIRNLHKVIGKWNNIYCLTEWWFKITWQTYYEYLYKLWQGNYEKVQLQSIYLNVKCKGREMKIAHSVFKESIATFYWNLGEMYIRMIWRKIFFCLKLPKKSLFWQ